MTSTTSLHVAGVLVDTSGPLRCPAPAPARSALRRSGRRRGYGVHHRRRTWQRARRPKNCQGHGLTGRYESGGRIPSSVAKVGDATGSGASRVVRTRRRTLPVVVSLERDATGTAATHPAKSGPGVLFSVDRDRQRSGTLRQFPGLGAIRLDRLTEDYSRR